MKILSETIIDGGKELEFEFLGRKCILCVPDNPRPDKRVLWRAEFFHAFENCDVEMFKMGYYRAYIRVSDMFGAPMAIELMKKFHDMLVSEFGLCEKMIVIGLSRGGLYSANYATKYPEDVAVLYLDAPVLSIKNWPLGMGSTARNEQECEKVHKAFETDDENAILAAKLQPLDNVANLAKADIPIIFVCGGADDIVDMHENTGVFLEEFKSLGGRCELHVKPDCGHHPHGLEDPKPIIEFIENCIK